MRRRHGGWRGAPLVVVLGAWLGWAPGLVGQAAPAAACPAGTRIEDAVIAVLDPSADVRFDRPITVRITRPVAAEQQATPGPGRFEWQLTLAESAVLREIALQPVRPGHLAELTGARSELRHGRCRAHFTFRLRPVWRAEIVSVPSKVVVEVHGDPQRYTTNFTTAPIPTGRPLTVRLRLTPADRPTPVKVLPVEVSLEELRSQGMIRYGTTDIRRQFCGGGSATECNFGYRWVKHMVTIRLVKPE